MHIFLTGPVKVGKSTLIDRVLARHPHWQVGGFRTVALSGDLGDGAGGVYIFPADGSRPGFSAQNRVGIRHAKRPCAAFPQIFDQAGLPLLEQAEGRELIVMDELGVMETQARAFCQKVLALLEGDVPILGVVKARPSPLLDAVRGHPRVQVLEVTPENREALADQIGRRLEQIISLRRQCRAESIQILQEMD